MRVIKRERYIQSDIHSFEILRTTNDSEASNTDVVLLSIVGGEGIYRGLYTYALYTDEPEEKIKELMCL